MTLLGKNRRWIAAIATLLALAGLAYLWFGPTGTTCVDYVAPRASQCYNTTFASSIPNAGLLAFAAVPALLWRRLWALVAWCAIIAVFFVVSFGIDMWLLPSAAAAMLAAVGDLGTGAGARS